MGPDVINGCSLIKRNFSSRFIYLLVASCDIAVVWYCFNEDHRRFKEVAFVFLSFGSIWSLVTLCCCFWWNERRFFNRRFGGVDCDENELISDENSENEDIATIYCLYNIWQIILFFLFSCFFPAAFYWSLLILSRYKCLLQLGKHIPLSLEMLIRDFFLLNQQEKEKETKKCYLWTCRVWFSFNFWEYFQARESLSRDWLK